MTNIPNQNSMKRMRHGTSLHCLLAEDTTDKNTIQGDRGIILKNHSTSFGFRFIRLL